MQYTLKNEFLEATFETFGAEMVSLKDDEGKEYLWCGDSKFWGRHSPVLFPFVGKVKDGKYTYKGNTYSISQHGFARDMEFEFLSQTEDEIWFVLNSTDETMQKYPFVFRLELGYKLMKNTVRVLWRVLNPAEDETLYFSIGAHPAFLCPVDEGTKQSDYFLQIKDAKTLEYSSACATRGLFLREKYKFELENERRQIVDGFFDLGERTTYIFENKQINEVSLVKPDGKPYVTVSFDMPVVGIWSPDKVQAPFVCIEPWCGRCDAVDFEGSLEDREWGQVLEAGGVFEQSYDIRIDK